MIPFDKIRQIAIFRRNGFGDVLCAIPLVLRCKELMPEAKITLFIEPATFGLASYLQGPDKVVEIPSGRNKYLNIAKLVWQIRKERFDLAISAKTTPMKLMNFTLYALRAPYRAAYTKGAWYDRLINCPRPYQEEAPLHQALQAIQLVDPHMQFLPERLYPSLQNITEPKRVFTKKTLFISLSNNRLGSTLSQKRMAWLLNTLEKDFSFSLIISCLAKDHANAKEFFSLLHMERQIFISKSFAEFLKLLQAADCIFACDGGIVHLSAALKKPSLFLFGGTKVSQWGPLNPLASTLFYPGHVMQIPKSAILEKLRDLLKSAP